ncbi:hypothetical protein [Streptomyces sp. GESEQ-35]|nr:hypothetical protein [Streptomyces sp. GESEQ-35]
MVPVQEGCGVALRKALTDIKAGALPNLRLPSYVTAPPLEGRPKLQVA